MRSLHKLAMPILVTCLTMLVGCSEDTPCDPGYIHVTSSCVPLPPEAAPPKPVADAGVDAGALDAAPVVVTGSMFGDFCDSAKPCTGEVSFCAAKPGSSGYCSRQGCDLNASICPPTWTCADLSFVGQGHFCSKP
jgi:hypothetical protein